MAVNFGKRLVNCNTDNDSYTVVKSLIRRVEAAGQKLYIETFSCIQVLSTAVELLG
jgi:hypothetical protein